MKKILFFLALLLMPHAMHAYSADVVVDTGGNTINALEGVIHIPQGVNIDDIQTGRSAILIWIKPPLLDKESGTISFSGISPGGFQGERPVMTLVGEMDERDNSKFTFTGIKALKNDGSGSEAPVTLKLKEVKIAEDSVPPEPFTPAVSSSEDVFDGSYFLSFATQDKGTGIDHYEVAGSWFAVPKGDEWSRAESPLVLPGNMAYEKIFVKAADKNGNTRIESIPGPYYYYVLAFGSIMLLCVLVFIRRSFYSSSYPL